jgi:NTE family protein
LSSFPAARAVAASPAVPVLFNPVVVRNYPDCASNEAQLFLQAARERVKESPELSLTVEGLETDFDRKQHKYIHFVDGDITDNLGLRALNDTIELSGGIRRTVGKSNAARRGAWW